MKKAKVFRIWSVDSEEASVGRLEKNLNDWLTTNNGVEIRSIHFAGTESSYMMVVFYNESTV